MKRRDFLKTTAAGAAAHAAAAQRAADRPNIVWIMADDLGVGDLGCYGQKHIRTPHIDRLAAEGVRYTQAYAGCTVCAPSRSVLMTGKHMGHTSVRSNPGGVPLIASDITVAEVLHRAGYRNGCFGKWGLGDVGTDGAPTKQGFDEFFGYLHQVHAHWYYPPHLYWGRKPGGSEERYPLKRNAGGERKQYSHDEIAAKALEFIRNSARQGPFFCYVPFTIPHVELLVPEDSLAEYRGKLPEKPYVDSRKHYADQAESRAAYAGMVTRMDRDAGRIMALLKELGVDDRTVVVFTSDNGGATRLWGDDFFESTLGLRGHKQNLYEGGIRTPMIARWPGRIRPGRTSDHPWYFADFLATAAELSGVNSPPASDGISVVPSLLEKGTQARHEYLYWELPRYDGQKGEFREELPMQAIRMGDWKLVRPKPDSAVELYNLAEDPKETTDVAAANSGVVERMERRMKEVRVEPRIQRQPPYGDGGPYA
jgi:arylsulfatase A-like enzyme